MYEALTERVLTHFRQLAAIPRPSKKEEKVAAWLQSWAAEHGFTTRRDAIGNLVIAAPATAGYKDAPTVVLQGHMDMVCEKTPDAPRDPATEGVSLLTEEDAAGVWLTADRTTLGADNGIAIAMALAVIEDPELARPAIEVLLTVDEETGLTGARNLDPELLTGSILLNIDSEDEGVLTVGCAGGRSVSLRLPLALAPTPRGLSTWSLSVGELTGGHSGVDIHLQRANANVLLARSLERLLRETDARVASLRGGSAHNAIPRDAEATLAMGAADLEVAQAIIAELQASFAREHASTDPELRLTLRASESEAATVFTEDCAARVVDALRALPNGVDRMSLDVAGLVQTSNNLATLRVRDEVLVVQSSQRSSSQSELNDLCHRVAAIGRLAGAEVSISEGYPGWEPDMDAPLLQTCREVYERRFEREPVVEIIHAGLECGVIGAVYPEMAMISFGPTIQNPHSPDERLLLWTVGACTTFLQDLLAQIAEA